MLMFLIELVRPAICIGFAGEPPAKGRIYDKKPFRFEVEAGKTYMWCSCGHSKNQVSYVSF